MIIITEYKRKHGKLPNDYSRCMNSKCPLRKDCLRWLDKPEGVMSYTNFQPIEGKCYHQITPKEWEARNL